MKTLSCNASIQWLKNVRQIIAMNLFKSMQFMVTKGQFPFLPFPSHFPLKIMHVIIMDIC